MAGVRESSGRREQGKEKALQSSDKSNVVYKNVTVLKINKQVNTSKWKVL